MTGFIFSFRSLEGNGATSYSGVFIVDNEMDLSQSVGVFVDTFELAHLFVVHCF
jgi:hypothetical protein